MHLSLHFRPHMLHPYWNTGLPYSVWFVHVHELHMAFGLVTLLCKSWMIYTRFYICRCGPNCVTVHNTFHAFCVARPSEGANPQGRGSERFHGPDVSRKPSTPKTTSYARESREDSGGQDRGKVRTLGMLEIGHNEVGWVKFYVPFSVPCATASNAKISVVQNYNNFIYQ